MSNYISKPQLKDCSINTLIKSVPDIINNNNKEILRVLSDIFEFGTDKEKNQYIKVPILTQGSVRANTGQFNNLYVNNIGITTNSASKDFLEVITDHNKSINRFINIEDETIKKLYTHDADSIVYIKGANVNNVKGELDTINKTLSLYKDNFVKTDSKINELDASIKELYNMLTEVVNKLNIEKVATINEVEDNLVETLNASTNSYTYSSQNYK